MDDDFLALVCVCSAADAVFGALLSSVLDLVLPLLGLFFFLSSLSLEFVFRKNFLVVLLLVTVSDAVSESLVVVVAWASAPVDASPLILFSFGVFISSTRSSISSAFSSPSKSLDVCFVVAFVSSPLPSISRESWFLIDFKSLLWSLDFDSNFVVVAFVDGTIVSLLSADSLRLCFVFFASDDSLRDFVSNVLPLVCWCCCEASSHRRNSYAIFEAIFLKPILVPVHNRN